MKNIPYLLLLIFYSCGPFQFKAYSQDTALRTYGGKRIDSSTCIFHIRVAQIISIDSLHSKIKKPKIERLINYLSSCDSKYVFDSTFQDKKFELVIPKYFFKVTYELGNQHFAIVLWDSTSERTIDFTYDLDDSYKNYFLKNDKAGFKKSGTVKLNGQTIYRFTNYDDRYAGTIFVNNHLEISYFTKSKVYERELQEIISKFNW